MRSALDALRHAVVHDPMQIVLPLAIFGLVLLAGWLVRRAVLHALEAWNARNPSRARKILYEGLKGPLWIWTLIVAVHFAVEASEIPARYAGFSSNVLVTLWILSLTLMSMRVAGDIVRYYGGEMPGAMPVATLTQSLTQIAILILGALILLAHFGVSITPMLTALGVGGLAVALALQDTLSNLFGGFYVAVAGQVRLGDYIKLNTGEEGYVTDIAWRCTTIRALANNLIIVPNSKLAQAIVINYHLPSKRIGVSFPVTVGYECDPKEVQRAIGEVLARAVGEVSGLLADPAPLVAFDPGFTENGIGLSVNYQVEEFSAQYPVRNELRQRIFYKLREIGAVVPYPSRTVYLRGGAGEERPSSRAG